MDSWDAPTRPPQRLRSLSWQGWLVVVLLGFGVPAVVRTLAYASPPDPTWFSGLYDDADHDDAVLLATSMVGMLSCAPPALAGPVSGVGAPSRIRPAPPRAVFHALELGRAPPATI